MFNIPHIFMVPVLASTVGGTLEWSAMGAVFAWLLILCLLCASVGLILEYDHVTSVPPDKRETGPTETDFDLPHPHREAA